MANGKIAGIGVHHIALSAADYKKSVAFYTEGLGFVKKAEWGTGTGRACLLDIGNGSHVEIFADGTVDMPANERFRHFAFAASDPDTAYAHALAAGAESHMAPQDVTIESDPPMNVRIAFVKGPDGELLEFFKTY